MLIGDQWVSTDRGWGKCDQCGRMEVLTDGLCPLCMEEFYGEEFNAAPCLDDEYDFDGDEETCDWQ